MSDHPFSDCCQLFPRLVFYEQFVTYDQYALTDYPEPLDTTILNINQQIREEAGSRLLRSNQWILCITSHDNLPEPEGCLKPFEVPRSCWRSCYDEAAIRFHIHELGSSSDGDHRPSNVYMFPYHPSSYGKFIQDVSNLTDHRWSVKVNIKPAQVEKPSRFKKLIGPFSTVRDMKHGSISGLSYATTAVLKSQMMQSPNSINSLMAAKKWYIKQGRQAELKGRYSDAAYYYRAEPWSPWGKLDRFELASPERNSLEHLDTDARIASARSIWKYLTWLRKTCPTGALPMHTRILFRRAFNGCKTALAFSGLTDRQRCEAHLYQALIFFDYGEQACDFFKYPLDLEVPDGELDFLAARCLFYAQQLGCWGDIAADLDEDELGVCKAIQETPGPQAYPLHEEDVPLLGVWRGDPKLWDSWTDRQQVLMKRFQQRHDPRMAGNGSAPPDLRAAYGDLGIAWSGDNDESFVLFTRVEPDED
ncbi:hypothetical protein PG999_011837 [Apiospora kogelbergensis]|uniref:HNH nuclease domain-containing protein n=1 Tax=Apiospora kogelbergensis TaxID=1337665 RepID=A0AAW0QE92_9PEZI